MQIITANQKVLVIVFVVVECLQTNVALANSLLF